MAQKPIDPGIYTQEGMHAGDLAAALVRDREKKAAEFAKRKAEITAAVSVEGVRDSHNKFTTSGQSGASIEGEFKSKTVGLVSVEEFKKARAEAVAKEAALKQQNAAASLAASLRASAAEAKPAQAAGSSSGGGTGAQKRGKPTLSFAADLDDEDDGGRPAGRVVRPVPASAKPASANAAASSGSAAAAPSSSPSATAGIDQHQQNEQQQQDAQPDGGGGSSSSSSSNNGPAANDGAGAGAGNDGNGGGGGAAKRPRIGKDPNVFTDFLPDAARDRRDAELREKLKQEYAQLQEKTRAEKLEIVYSYWDGSGHRRALTITKGSTIGKFLERVRQDLLSQFPELQRVSSDDLLYVKEDLILSHGLSFYDLIATKARGKSGPLFEFGVRDDIRVLHDARVEKDESHPGKVVERRWYDKNKHIFPASRWELYDPLKKYDGEYTQHGKEIHGKYAGGGK